MIGEVIAGFDGDSRANENKMELQRLLESSKIRVYPITPDTPPFFRKSIVLLKARVDLSQHMICGLPRRPWSMEMRYVHTTSTLAL